MKKLTQKRIDQIRALALRPEAETLPGSIASWTPQPSDPASKLDLAEKIIEALRTAGAWKPEILTAIPDDSDRQRFVDDVVSLVASARRDNEQMKLARKRVAARKDLDVTARALRKAAQGLADYIDWLNDVGGENNFARSIVVAREIVLTIRRAESIDSHRERLDALVNPRGGRLPDLAHRFFYLEWKAIEDRYNLCAAWADRAGAKIFRLAFRTKPDSFRSELNTAVEAGYPAWKEPPPSNEIRERALANLAERGIAPGSDSYDAEYAVQISVKDSEVRFASLNARLAERGVTRESPEYDVELLREIIMY